MELQGKIFIAFIAAAHGLKGEVKLKSFSVAEDGLASYTSFYDDNNKHYQIEKIRVSGKYWLAKLQDVDDRNSAEQLIGTKFYIKREQLGNLAEEEFFHSDLLGLLVKDNGDNEVGKIIAIHNFGAEDLLEVKPSSHASFYIAFNKHNVVAINLKDGFVVVSNSALDLVR